MRTKVCQGEWKERIASYYKKVNSNQLDLIAEVISELYPLVKNHIYSMRELEIYQSALDLFAQELAVVESCEMESALEKIESFTKSQGFSLMMPLAKS